MVEHDKIPVPTECNVRRRTSQSHQRPHGEPLPERHNVTSPAESEAIGSEDHRQKYLTGEQGCEQNPAYFEEAEG